MQLQWTHAVMHWSKVSVLDHFCPVKTLEKVLSSRVLFESTQWVCALKMHFLPHLQFDPNGSLPKKLSGYTHRSKEISSLKQIYFSEAFES